MEVIIQEDWNQFSTRFYIEQMQHDRRMVLGQDNDGQLIWQDVEEGSLPSVKPLLKLPSRIATLFIDGVVDHASRKGLKTVNENLLQGKLTATEKHLEDMRQAFTKTLDKLLTK